MKITSISGAYFSPTGTTRTIAETIARNIGAERIELRDITSWRERRDPVRFHDGCVILATPVYYGRVPEAVASCFSTFRAERTAAILVVVYGNRAYEDALRELYDIAVAANFVPVAAGAFVGEHSYSSPSCPIAEGRPDAGDLQLADGFAARVREKLLGMQSTEPLPLSMIPGKVPYVEPVNLHMIRKAREVVALTPESDGSKCRQCGRCSEVCPSGAISPEDASRIDRWKCILCFACVKNCPEGAMQMMEPNFLAAIRGLQNICQRRREPEFFV